MQARWAYFWLSFHDRNRSGIKIPSKQDHVGPSVEPPFKGEWTTHISYLNRWLMLLIWLALDLCLHLMTWRDSSVESVSIHNQSVLLQFWVFYIFQHWSWDFPPLGIPEMIINYWVVELARPCYVLFVLPLNSHC
jgi:hypothetical protein